MPVVSFEVLDHLKACPSVWLHHWPRRDKSPDVSFGRAGSISVLRFATGAEFGYEREAAKVTTSHEPSALVRHHLLDQVLPRVLNDLGHLMVHASAVADAGDEGGVVFLGDSGFGKSTLAAHFYANGHALLTDDCVRLDPSQCGVELVGTYPGLRLWPDTIDAVAAGGQVQHRLEGWNDKQRLAVSNEHALQGRHRLRAIFVLSKSDGGSSETVVRELPARTAVSELLRQTFRLDLTDNDATARTFDQCARVAAVTPVYGLSYPRAMAELPRVRDAILRCVATT
jgi:hypothetical protein